MFCRYASSRLSSVPPRLHSAQLLRSAWVYVVANAINSAIPLLLLPILTRYLSPQDYGLVAMFTVVMAVVASIAGLGTHGAITREYYRSTQSEFATFVGTCVLILLATAGVLVVAVLLFAAPLSELSGIPGPWLVISVLMGTGQLLCSIALVVWQVRGMPLVYGAFQIAGSLLNALLSLALVIGMGMSWQGRVIGQVAALSGMGAVGILWLAHAGWINFRFSKEYARQALRYGIPLVFHGLGATVVATADRTLITSMVGLEQTGLYAVAAQIAMVITFLADSFNRAYAPWLYQNLKSGDTAIRRRIVIGTYQYFVAILFLAAALMITAPWLVSVFVGPRFASATTYICWLALASAFSGMYYMVTLYIQFSGKTERLAAVTLSVGAVHIALCYTLIGLEGGLGAAKAAAISQLLTFLATWVFAASTVEMNWFLRGRKSADLPR